MLVRRMTAADAEAVARITAESPEAAQWSAADYARAASSHLAWVAEGHGVEGFLVAGAAAGEMEILDLAVTPAARRRGIAGLLLDAALEEARGLRTEAVFLEVRASNCAAVAFYEKHGFAQHGTRGDYYSSPKEDAVVLRLALPDGAQRAGD